MSLPANLKNFADADGRIARLPVKWAKKAEVADWLLTRLDSNKVYTEFEINDEFEKYVDDFALIRRLLVDSGKLARETDCSAYWVAK